MTTDRTRVSIGDIVTLNCNARGNPSIYSYEWTNLNTSNVLKETTATLTFHSIQMSEIATYRCEVNNTVGSGTGSISIMLGGK